MLNRAVSRKRWLWALLGSLASALYVAPALAQDATEPALKSALIFNFAKFTTWPDDALPPNTAFVACVVGNREVGQALERAFKDHAVAGHRVEVVSRDGRDAQQSFRTCHLLYVTNVDAKQLVRIMTGVRGAPVLTIVDADDANTSSGIAHLFVENGRLRFDIDRGLARQGRLELSSRLLSVASKVREESRVREDMAVSR
jgi:hypothetical protein